MDCRHHHASHAHVQVYFELLCRCILTWCLYVLTIFYQMVTFHCWGNFILKTRFYSTLQYREMMHFLPCPTFVENWSNRSSGVQIQRYLYSFWVLFVLCWVKLNNNTCYSFQQHEKWNLPFSSVLLLISTDSTFPNDLKRSLCTCHSEKRRFNFNSAC